VHRPLLLYGPITLPLFCVEHKRKPLYTEQVRECNAEIERRFQAIKPVGPDALPPLDRENKHRTHNKNAPDYDARGMLYQLTGVDLVAIPGLHASTAQTILSEIGLDLRRWPNAKAFCSWLGPPPTTRSLGGRSCAGVR
jgi:transposase